MQVFAEPRATFTNEKVAMPIVKIEEKTVYVPMGRHIALNCSAWIAARSSYPLGPDLIIWVFHDIEDDRDIFIDIDNQ
ncbi:unnamed protein product [Thelazia callipaeda]|uniref:Uncharacterized protein n=1 Tax=Thelazia callipaeda TaxID=103827 RepID=A0A0N5CQR0_THECL|nr:unnamed protein product [Thelazia callipaeda]